MEINREETGRNIKIEKNESINEKINDLEEKNSSEESKENTIYSEELMQDNINSLIDRKKSSDSTSISLSNEENISQASEISLLCPYANKSINQNNNINITNSNDLCQEKLNYFYGVENYFFNVMPDKFSEYKKSKNYLPKNNNNINEEDIKELENETVDENNIQMVDNKFNNNCIANNNFYPIFGNIFYYTYNNLYFNYQNQNIRNNNDITNTNNYSNTNKIIYQETKEKKKENIIPKEKKIKNLKNDFVNSNDEQDINIYIIKKINKNCKKNNNVINKNNKNIYNYSETINHNYKFSKYKYNYKYTNYNYKNSNHTLVEKKKEIKKNNFMNNNNSNNYYYCKKPRKIIYY
jgi:hypothetical protein